MHEHSLPRPRVANEKFVHWTRGHPVHVRAKTPREGKRGVSPKGSAGERSVSPKGSAGEACVAEAEEG